LSYRRGAFTVSYYETRLPVAPRTYALILAPVVPVVREKLGEYHPDVLELESIITAISHLPPRTETDPEKVKERRREKEIVKRRLAALTERSREVRAGVNSAVSELNGRAGDARSFDRLEELLAAQAYRLSYWRVAADEINYRRFFDINELAAIRVEEPQVFAAVHELVFKLMRQGFVTGLRIDHVDGLFDPEQYLRDLQRGSRRALRQSNTSSLRAQAPGCYVVVEKILGHDERLPAAWPCHGTTGYDFLNLVNGLFVVAANEASFRRLYRRFTAREHNFARRVYEAKKLILRVAMSSELHVLARRLDRVSEQRRDTRDFTLNSLQYALGEVIACFPVYRTYTRPDQREVSAEDRARIAAAIRDAKRRNPAISPSVFDFIASLLLLEDPDGLTEEQRAERRMFVLRFQQLTGPVTAKGVEDTAFYRSYPLASLNEVGGEPARFGVAVDEFHRQIQRRAREWPHTMNATATHDTKRGEDVRARLNVLSEIPVRWYRAVSRWRNLNQEKKSKAEGHDAPDTHAEYLLYQTLVGAWPFGEMNEGERAEFVERIQGYFVKALKEAKIHSSWISPNEEYERAARDFVARILEPGEENQFLADFVRFQSAVAHAGVFNSLAQSVVKATAPGVPDYYQGTELWDLSLVDPDNRRPVDYGRRRAMLDELRAGEGRARAELVDELVRSREDGRIKLYVVSRALNFRRAHAALFTDGDYSPVPLAGARAANAVAFARTRGDKTVIVAVGRFFTQLLSRGDAEQLPVGAEVWGDTSLALEGKLAAGCYRDVLTGEQVCLSGAGGRPLLPLAQAFARLPVAILEKVTGDQP
jgi:(1->4)-alpha-D-glucan 1-alpha-D-glucosylmutase